MFKNQELWRELSPRERLVIVGAKYEIVSTSQEKVPVKRLEFLTGIPSWLLIEDLKRLRSWGFVRNDKKKFTEKSKIQLSGAAARIK